MIGSTEEHLHCFSHHFRFKQLLNYIININKTWIKQCSITLQRNINKYMNVIYLFLDNTVPMWSHYLDSTFAYFYLNWYASQQCGILKLSFLQTCLIYLMVLVDVWLNLHIPSSDSWIITFFFLKIDNIQSKANRVPIVGIVSVFKCSYRLTRGTTSLCFFFIFLFVECKT